MAGSLKVNSVQLGDSPTATNNFVLKTNVDGTAKLSRGNDGATTQDILTIDAAGNMSAGLQRIIHRGNLLGTVSQSAGVPTGAVIERGSNANGNYTRYADGTQIYWAEVILPGGALNTQLTIAGNFAATFSAPPNIQYSCIGSSGTGNQEATGQVNRNGIFTNSTTSTYSILCYTYVSVVNNPVIIAVTASGRWY